MSLVLFPSSPHPLLPVSMVSPLKPEEFAAKLSKHPDQCRVAFVLDRQEWLSRGISALQQTEVS